MNLETKLPQRLWEAIRSNYERQNYTPAILDAFYFLSDLIRAKSGLEGDGAPLIGSAFGGATPKIRINRLQTDSEWNVQRGIEMMLRGFYQAVRNPRSHDKFSDSEADAQVIILFIGYLVEQIDKAKAQFSRDEYLKRVLDPDFVPNSRYAELLVAEIPPRHRMDVFLDIFRERDEWKPESMRHFLPALLSQLAEEELSQVYQFVSDELATTETDSTIRVVLASFSADSWLRISETARLRIENKLIKSVRDGRHDARTDTCRGGALGTWSTGIFRHFTLKKEMLSAISDKLWSRNEEEREYILRYFFVHLDHLSDSFPSRIESALKNRLKAGDQQVFNALEFVSPWEMDQWPLELKTAYDTFEPKQSTNDFSDDIPF